MKLLTDTCQIMNILAISFKQAYDSEKENKIEQAREIYSNMLVELDNWEMKGQTLTSVEKQALKHIRDFIQGKVLFPQNYK